MSDWHSFSVDVACKVGVNAAIILGNIKHWCKKNKANGKHLHDGLYWSYNSIKAFSELYPYLGKGAIDNALKKLESGGYVKVGNYNKTPYDRTKWYAITAKGLALFDEKPFTEEETHFIKQEIQEPQSENPNGSKQKPIPDIDQLSTSYKPVIKQSSEEVPFAEIIAYLNEKTGRSYRNVESNRKHIRARWNEYPDLTTEQRMEMFKHCIDAMCSVWLGDGKMEMYLRPQTLFGSKFEGYANQPIMTKRQRSQRQKDLSEHAEPSVGTIKSNWNTGKKEVYKGNGVWEEYVSDYVPQEGDEDIEL